MRSIVRASLRFRWIVLFLAAATLALGFIQIPETKVDVFPEFAPPQIEIQTIALGNSSNEVEQLITVPIEDQLGGIEGLSELRSKSVAQLSSIRLIFERGADELKARQLVQERLSQITPTLPTWASPPFMMPALSATSRIMKIGLTSDTVSPTDLSAIAYWKIRSRLLRVPGSHRSPSGVSACRNATSRSIQPSSPNTKFPCKTSWTPQPIPSSRACSATPTVRLSVPAGLSRLAVSGSTFVTYNRSSNPSSSRRCLSWNATARCCGLVI